MALYIHIWGLGFVFLIAFLTLKYILYNTRNVHSKNLSFSHYFPSISLYCNNTDIVHSAYILKT